VTAQLRERITRIWVEQEGDGGQRLVGAIWLVSLGSGPGTSSRPPDLREQAASGRPGRKGQALAMGEALRGAALLAAEALAGLGVAVLGAVLTVVARRRRRLRRGAVVASWQAASGHQQAGQAWVMAWRAHMRLVQLEDRVSMLEADLADRTSAEASGRDRPR